MENYSTSGDDQIRLHIRLTGRMQIIKSDTIFHYFHYNVLATDNLSDGKTDLKMFFVNSSSFCHLDIETCPAGTPVDFHVTGFIPRNPEKTAKLKPTDFRENFLLFLVFDPADSTT